MNPLTTIYLLLNKKIRQDWFGNLIITQTFLHSYKEEKRNKSFDHIPLKSFDHIIHKRVTLTI